MEDEHYFICPYCGENISMVIDMTVRRQRYFEDCEVCCKPILIDYTADNDKLMYFEAATADE
ncbi:MAG TPA: CPXCG motif-containing cysteine-rich protein [Pyrinomonadaceae bacterium]|nr:CPXCG motif-containing cysteine-rich protein [Pyrinomonadaceae bacterium]HMP64400.1 CPXCG motif-containing cysteine-rich protein [Pyrinomonadaceae bacterium]